MGADRSGGVLPLLEHLPGQLLLQLVCGLLPGLTSAVAHLYRVIARALDLLCLGVGRTMRQHQGAKEQQVLHQVLFGLISRVWMLSAIGDCLGGKGLNELLDAVIPRLGIADANKFALSSHNLRQGLDCCLSTQILFSTLG